LHNVEVKLVGDMRTIDSKLGRNSTVYEYFKLNTQEDHVRLCFPDDEMDFGYLRSGVGKTLAPLLAKPCVELEPLVLTSNLKQVIGRANKSADAMVKVDINAYGPRRTAADVGDALSDGKLWLQKSDHAKAGVFYDNPHFFPIRINGIQMQSIQPVNQRVDEGVARRKHRGEQLRNMVKEVYRSIDNTRHLDMVEGGERVARKLLK
jgi:SWI/SNF-related matrix-associated actin-dependent regulator of chromatin subfamily A3